MVAFTVADGAHLAKHSDTISVSNLARIENHSYQSILYPSTTIKFYGINYLQNMNKSHLMLNVTRKEALQYSY